jgi:hypothetical protein
MDVKSALQALPIVPAERIDSYSEDGTQPLGNDHVPVPLAQAVEAFEGYGEDEIGEGEERLRAEWYDGAGNENGVVAIRCGDNAFVLHSWVTRE